MRTAIHLAVLASTSAALSVAHAQENPHEWGERNAPTLEPAYEAQFRAPIEVSPYALDQEVLASGLVHPWAVEELPGDGGYLVTERPGRLRHIAEDGTVSDPIAGVPEVLDEEQGGLLDVKAGPSFAQDRMVYLTYAKPIDAQTSATAAARGRLSEDFSRLEDVEDIFVQTPPSSSPMHYGSRIVFDGEEHAFVTTGEHFTFEERDFAQQTDKTYGVVARVGLDGSIPEDNPFFGREDAHPAIWSYGHRNIQGAAMRDGFLYTIEHGPEGGDELNIPFPGRNYGWPIISYGRRYDGPFVGSGEAQMAGLEQPLYFWDPVIAPGDLDFYEGEEFPEWDGDILIAALVAPGIVRLEMNGPLVQAEERLLPDIGRVRDVEVLEDGSFLIVTDYEDGEIIRVTASGG